jgi:CBS domain containing-hemolysin-like protein
MGDRFESVPEGKGLSFVPYDLLTIKLILLAFLLLLSAFFSGSEAAFFSLTPLHLHKMKEEHYPFLAYVQRLLKYPRRLLITIIVVNEAANITISAVAASLFIYFFGSQGQWMTVVVMTPVLLIFGEALPKTFAVTHPMRLSAFLSPLLIFVSQIVRPVVWVLEMVSGFFIRQFSRDATSRRHVLMEDEFRTLIDVGEKEGALESAQRNLIHKVFDLGDTTIAEIMIPRVDMFCLSVSMQITEIEREIIKARHDRIPIYGSDRDDIVGVLYARDLLERIVDIQTPVSIAKISRKPFFVPEAKTAISMLRDFQAMRIQIAIVVDEYGGVSGLVTLEDILNHLYEDIYDTTNARDPLWQRVDDRTILASGKMSMEDLKELLLLAAPEEDFETVGGFVFHLFGKLPVRGESVSYDHHTFRVEQMGKARILKVRIEREDREALDHG